MEFLIPHPNIHDTINKIFFALAGDLWQLSTDYSYKLPKILLLQAIVHSRKSRVKCKHWPGTVYK